MPYLREKSLHPHCHLHQLLQLCHTHTTASRVNTLNLPGNWTGCLVFGTVPFNKETTAPTQLAHMDLQ